MSKKLIVAGVLSVAMVSGAFAWNDLTNSVFGHKSNDTGGIIPWTPENEAASFEIATKQCARWNKFPVATSIHRVPGDYIAYKCVWDPPEVAVVRHHRRIDVRIDK